jgi:Rrf2 family transcriptional regulator, cysteine metabolism repressor
MKLSTKGRYGLRAMMDLAARATDRVPVLLSDVAKRQNISEKYLEHIFAALRTAGLVHTVRGRKGGFLLSKAPRQITAGNIVTALEGPCRFVDCVSKPEVCAKSGTCAARDVWTELENKVEEVLGGFTLDELVKMQEHKSGKDSAMYYI